jgi:hypothetical protein
MEKYFTYALEILMFEPKLQIHTYFLFSIKEKPCLVTVARLVQRVF